MVFNLAAALFALASIAGAAALLLLLFSLVVRRISRKASLFTLAGSAVVALVALIVAGITMPPTTPATSAHVVAKATMTARAHDKSSSHRTTQASSDLYTGEPAETLARKYRLSSSDLAAVMRAQRTCTTAHTDDARTRAARDSMAVALELERAAAEWDACDSAVQQTIADVQALQRLNDYDDVGMFGVIRDHPLLEESGAYGSAGTEWQQFGQPARAVEDLRDAVDVGRRMVKRGYADEGQLVISDNEGALRDALSEQGQ